MNLVLGSTSQLSHYFPEDYIKISSREIDLNSLKKTKWDAVYICFGEHRTYLTEIADEKTKELFWSINVQKTLDVIDNLKEVSNKIVYYSTAELWNNTTGPIQLTDPFCFYENIYTNSKRIVSGILRDKKKYPNVSVLYPFNFNSVYRAQEFLFGKIFKAIINKTPISIGDVQYYRELLHPQMVVDASVENLSGVDEVVGSGRVVHVGDFIELLYTHSGLNYREMVKEDTSRPSIYRKNVFYSSKRNKKYDVDHLIDLTVKELKTLTKG